MGTVRVQCCAGCFKIGVLPHRRSSPAEERPDSAADLHSCHRNARQRAASQVVVVQLRRGATLGPRAKDESRQDERDLDVNAEAQMIPPLNMRRVLRADLLPTSWVVVGLHQGVTGWNLSDL